MIFLYTLCTCRKKSNKIQLLCELSQGKSSIKNSKANIRGARRDRNMFFYSRTVWDT